MGLNEFRISVEVKAPREKVWNSLIDWKSQSEWMALTRVTSNVDETGDSGIGTEIHAFTGIGKFGIWDHMRVTEWNPPVKCTVDHYGNWIKGIGVFELVDISDTTTQFHWYEKIDAPIWILAMLKPGILIAVSFSLRRFARSVAKLAR